ncbi:MAG TPA: tyrosine recombinase [Planctomycetota bacterium]|jgi:integrase/recombinase XerD|nr:tyrosine recombinase [Planctomycetota bacterium]
MASESRPQQPALTRAIDDFIDCLRVEAGLRRNTLRAYRADLEHFVRWSGRRDGDARLDQWRELSSDLVVDWLADQRARGLAESTVARSLVSLRLLAGHLLRAGELSRDPTARIDTPRLRRSLPSVLSVDQVKRLLAAPSGDSWIALRDRALLETLYACGARISEAVSLRTDALEPRLRVLRLTGKGNKTRLVPLGSAARSSLTTWLETGRPQLPGAARSPWVFLTHSGRPLDRSNAWRRVRAAARAAELPAAVAAGLSPHSLRHSFASHLIEGGGDLRAVQELLGHASIQTTEVYTHLNVEHIRSLHRLYHPRG